MPAKPYTQGYAQEHNMNVKGKGKVIPITGLCGPEGVFRYRE